MEDQIISLTLANIPVRLRLRHGFDRRLFEGFLTYAVPVDAPVISVSQAHLDACRALYPAEMSDILLEYNELPGCISEYLLRRDCCVFHGVAFLWRGRAYLFTAPSGTGKSTQYVLWKEILGDDMRIINGDKPILRLEQDGTIWVHPSPWQGKEDMGRQECGKLGGVILLEQGTENAVCPISAAEAVVPLFLQFQFHAESEESVRRVCQLESRMLEQVPVWRMVNRGDTDSARQCIHTIIRFEEDQK